MEQSAKELVTRLRAVIDTAIDGIITINDTGYIETINPAGSKMFGYEPNELVGHKVNVLMTRHDRIHHDQYINNYLETRVPKIIGIGREIMGKKKTGDVFPCRLAVSEVFLNDRVIFTGILHDLTEVHEAQEEVRKLNRQLEKKVQERTNELEEVVNKLLRTNQELEMREQQLNEALIKERELGELKSRFVSMASHEFRTPLSTILSSSALIRKYSTEEQQHNRERHIEKIKRAVDNLTGILNDFLSLSKLEEGKVATNFQRIDLFQLCLDLKDDLTGLIKDGKMIEVRSDGPKWITTDERITRNILFNLLSNAIKYSYTDGKIICQLSTSDQMLVIEVIDQGIGIPEEDHKHIFTRFYRAQNVENIQGTGLGLNIVKRYLELLKGQIYFESNPGKGTTFTVKLPLHEQ